MANPGTYPKGVDKHADVLRAALRVFARDGDAGTTTRAVAAEAGLSPAGLRHYFPTRDELLTAMLKSFDEPFETSWTLRGARPAPDEVLVAALARSRRHRDQMALYLTLLAEAIDPMHPAAKYFRSRFERWRSLIADYVREQQDQGGISNRVDSEYVAHALLAVADGMQRQWLVDRTIDVDGYVRQTWRHLIA